MGPVETKTVVLDVIWYHYISGDPTPGEWRYFHINLYRMCHFSGYHFST